MNFSEIAADSFSSQQRDDNSWYFYFFSIPIEIAVLIPRSYAALFWQIGSLNHQKGRNERFAGPGRSEL